MTMRIVSGQIGVGDAMDKKIFTVIANKAQIRHQEWLSIRQGYIGGSDAAGCVGLSPWASPFSVWLSKSKKEDDAEDDSKQALKMWYGNAAEEIVAKRFVMETGKKVRRNNAMMVSTKYPWMLADIDRELVDEDAILEIKTTSAWNRDQWADGMIPIHYEIQCHHYMAVTGAKKCYIAVMLGAGDGFEIREIERDEDTIHALVEEEKKFWRLVETGEMPSPDGTAACTEAINRLFPGRADGGGDPIELDEKAFDTGMYFYLKDKRDALSQEIEAMEQDVKIAMQNSEKAIVGDSAHITWRLLQSKRLDSRRLKKEMPEIFERYAKVSEYRRFSVTRTEEKEEE